MTSLGGVGANYYTGVDNDTRFYTAGIMYETGPWQISAMWAGFYNTNGNGSSNVTAIAPGTQIQTLSAGNASGSPFGPNPNSTLFTFNPSTQVLFGQEVVQKWEIGANYALGPGIKAVGGFQFYNAYGPSNAVVGNSWAVMLGMDLRF
jgi:hypothetical protein